MVMGNSENSRTFNYANLLISQKFDAHGNMRFYSDSSRDAICGTQVIIVNAEY